MKKKLKGFKYFIILLSVLFSLTFILFGTYSIYTYIEIRNNQEEISEEYLSNFTGKINTLISGFDNMSTQIAMLPSVNNISYDTEAKDLSEFYKLSKDLDIFSNNKIINSIYLYFNASATVFNTSGGLDKLDEFFEKDLIKSLNKDEKYYVIYPLRSIKRIFFTPDTINVFTFCRQIPAFNSGRGYVLLNIDYASLTSMISANLPSADMEVSIVKDNQIVYSTSNILEKYLRSNNFKVKDKIIKIDNKNFILKENKLYQYDFTVYSILPMSVINSLFISRIYKISYIFALTILIEILLCWFFSSLMTKPIDKLIKKIQLNNPHFNSQSEGLNGIDGLNIAIDGLFTYANDIVSTVQANKPVLRESMLLNMLWGNDNSINQKDDERLSEYDIIFDRKYYYVIICMIDEIDRVRNSQIKDQIKFYINENVCHAYSPFGNIYGVLVDNDRVAFILNSQLDIYNNSQELQHIFDSTSQIHEHMKTELNVNVLFSIGTAEVDYKNMYKSYISANNNLMYSSVFNGEAIVFSDKNSSAAVIDKLFYNELITFIINRDEASIHTYVNTLTEKCLREKFDEPQIKRLLITMVSSIYTSLWEKDIDISANNLTYALSKINSINDFSKIHTQVVEILKGISMQIGTVFDEQQNRKIYSALNFINKNYAKDISVSEIADSVGLNHIYLNRIFKLSTGKTISEYLNIYRIEKSKELLTRQSLSINEISRMIGYNDVRSYIRFFKKFSGTTPNDYRSSTI